MAVRQGSFQSENFGVSSDTEYVVDVPAGMTCCTIQWNAMGWSGTVPQLCIAPSSGGTTLSRAWRQLRNGNERDRVSDFTTADFPGPLLSFTEDTDVHGFANVWNLNTAAPMVVSAKPASQQSTPDTIQWQHATVKSAVPVTQFIVSVSGGQTMNAGVLSIQFYKRPTTVYSHDFTAIPDTEWEITGLKASTDSLLIGAAYDLGFSASNSLRVTVSTDGGSTYDSGASDYRYSWVTNTGGDTEDRSYFIAGPFSSTAHGLCFELWGAPLLTRTQIWAASMASSGTGRQYVAMRRQARQIEDAIRLHTNAGATINAGTGYVVGYKL